MKETKIIRPEKNIKSQSILSGLSMYPLLFRYIMTNANVITVKEIIIGAKIGPTQGPGIKKRISLVSSEGGQFKVTLSQI